MPLGGLSDLEKRTIQMDFDVRNAQVITDLMNQFQASRATIALWVQGLRNGVITSADFADSMKRLLPEMEKYRQQGLYAIQVQDAYAAGFNKVEQHEKWMAEQARKTSGDHDEAIKKANNRARVLLEISRGVEDFSMAGMRGVINNIPQMVYFMAQGMGKGEAAAASLAGKVSLVATAVYVLGQQYERIAKISSTAVQEGMGPAMESLRNWVMEVGDVFSATFRRDVPRDLETMKAQLARATATVKELGAETHLTDRKFQELARAKETVQDLTQAIKDATEAQALFNAKTKEQTEAGAGFQEATKRVGGPQFQKELEEALRKQAAMTTGSIEGKLRSPALGRGGMKPEEMANALAAAAGQGNVRAIGEIEGLLRSQIGPDSPVLKAIRETAPEFVAEQERIAKQTEANIRRINQTVENQADKFRKAFEAQYSLEIADAIQRGQFGVDVQESLFGRLRDQLQQEGVAEDILDMTTDALFGAFRESVRGAVAGERAGATEQEAARLVADNLRAEAAKPGAAERLLEQQRNRAQTAANKAEAERKRAESERESRISESVQDVGGIMGPRLANAIEQFQMRGMGLDQIQNRFMPQLERMLAAERNVPRDILSDVASRIMDDQVRRFEEGAARLGMPTQAAAFQGQMDQFRQAVQAGQRDARFMFGDPRQQMQEAALQDAANALSQLGAPVERLAGLAEQAVSLSQNGLSREEALWTVVSRIQQQVNRFQSDQMNGWARLRGLNGARGVIPVFGGGL
jgi:hypothetical protein